MVTARRSGIPVLIGANKGGTARVQLFQGTGKKNKKPKASKRVRLQVPGPTRVVLKSQKLTKGAYRVVITAADAPSSSGLVEEVERPAVVDDRPLGPLADHLHHVAAREGPALQGDDVDRAALDLRAAAALGEHLHDPSAGTIRRARCRLHASPSMVASNFA